MRGRPSEQQLSKELVVDVDCGRNGAAINGAGDTGGPVSNDVRPLEPEREPQEDNVPEFDVQDTLGHVLALEKQVAELETWRTHVGQDISALLGRADALKGSLADEHSCARNVVSQASVHSQHAADFTACRERARAENDSVCSQLQLEVCKLMTETGGEVSEPSKCKGLESSLNDVGLVVRTLESEAHEAQLEHAAFSACFEEAHAQRRQLTENHEQFVRESRSARHAVQTQSTALNRLQADELRNRTKGDRKRRQCANQLIQCRGELADAAGRADVAAEQLRKVRQQHGRQLRALRAETGDLQAEVDAHLHFVEASEAELAALHSERSQLEGGQERHARQELLLQQHAAALRADAEALECRVQAREAEGLAAQEALRTAEAGRLARLGEGPALEEGLAGLRLAAERSEALSAELAGELSEQRPRLEGRSADAAELQALRDRVLGARAARAGAAEEHGRLHDGCRALQQAQDRHASDMREAARRALRVKTSHDEVLEALPSWSAKGREAFQGTTEQSLGRVGKKAEALLSYLESSGPGPKRVAVAEGQLTSQHIQPSLQTRLQVETERSMEVALTAQRRKVVLEQQRSLDETARRADEMRRSRHERRQLEAQVAQRLQAWSWAHSSAEAELEGMRAQMRTLDEDASGGGEVVTAEFSDLLQKQSLDRDSLQRQVNELRKEVEGARQDASRNDKDKDESEEESLPVPVLLQYLSERELEVDLLRKEEEAVQQAFVKLKAVAMASGASRNMSPGQRSSSKALSTILGQTSSKQSGRSHSSPRRGIRAAHGASFGPGSSVQSKETSTPATPHAPSRHEGIGSPSPDAPGRGPGEADQTPVGASAQLSPLSWQRRGGDPPSASASGLPAPMSTSAGALRSGSEGSASPHTLSTSASTPT